MLGNDILMLGKSLIKWKQRPDIIIAVDLDVKHQFKQTNTCADPETFLRGGPKSHKGSDGKFQHGKN